MGSFNVVAKELNFQYKMEKNNGVGSRSRIFLAHLDRVDLKGKFMYKGEICKHQETKHSGDKIEVDIPVSLLKVLIFMKKVPRKML